MKEEEVLSRKLIYWANYINMMRELREEMITLSEK